jgi:phosphatidate cytidylyltransferase
MVNGNMIRDRQTLMLFGGVLALLVIATIIGQLVKLRKRHAVDNTVVDNLNARIRAWWVMSAVFALSLLTGGLGSVILFAILSFFALREFITLTPTRPADHSALFWVFFIILPLQYYLVATQWYGFFSVLIPVYAFLFIPSRIAISGDAEGFLERSSKIQWGLMVCVYCVSHVPALLMLEIPGYAGKNARLLFFLVVVVQLSDVFQYVWGKLLGRHKIAPVISPSKTWEGFIGGTLSATLVGTALWQVTPFTMWQTMGMAFIITLMGFLGGLTMSAIKRDRGVKDWGSAIQGHGGVLDRIDSICFAGPIFFHLTRYFFT